MRTILVFMVLISTLAALAVLGAWVFLPTVNASQGMVGFFGCALMGGASWVRYKAADQAARGGGWR